MAEPGSIPDTIPHRLFERGRLLADRPAVHIKDKASGAWNPITWSAYAEQVRDAARALIALGVEPGDRVCLLGFNSLEWAVLDLATMAVGAVPAGIYTTCSPEEVRYVLTHAEAKVALVELKDHWDKVAAVRDDPDGLPGLHIVTMRSSPAELAQNDAKTLSWDAFVAKGKDVAPSLVDERVAELRLDQPGTFIYTSGTTGPPKAVMLTHDNLAWTASLSMEIVHVTPDDTSLSYLPLSHIAETMFTLLGPASSGAQVYFATSLERVAEELREVQPTVVFGVPRIWEKIHAGITAKLAEAPPARQRVARWAMGVGRRVSDAKNHGRAPSLGDRLQYRLAKRLVFDKLKPLIGLGKARACVSGAAPISREVLEFFAGLDVVVQEVYGQSEDTGPTSFNLAGATRYGTVGQPLKNTEVKIADDGEILVRGRHVFAGYFKDPVATAEVLKDGWLYSGDLGALDSEGFLTITGRKKEILITAGGKNIAPTNIEAAIKDLPLVSQAVVIGDRRPYLVALVALDAAAVAAAGLDASAARAQVDAGIRDVVNPRFARVEHVRKFTVLPRELSIDAGELTPTMKLKRKVVNERYAAEIDALYAGAADA